MTSTPPAPSLPPAPQPLTTRQGRVQSFPDLSQPPRVPRSSPPPPLHPTTLDNPKRSPISVPSPSLNRPHRRASFDAEDGHGAQQPGSQKGSPALGGVSPTTSTSTSPLLRGSGGLQSFSEKRRLGKGKEERHGRWERWKRRLRQLYGGPEFWVVVYSVFLLLTSVGNSIYFKKVTHTHRHSAKHRRAG